MVLATGQSSQYSYFKNAKTRMPAERPDRDVVPHPGVVFEVILQPLCEVQFAACIELRRTEGGDEGGHGRRS